MGLTKQYLRYQPAGVYNVVGSTRAGIVLVDQSTEIGESGSSTVGQHCAVVGACEQVIVWNLRKGEMLMRMDGGSKHEVSALARSPDGVHVAAGYLDGSVRIFHIATGDCVVTFNGHRKEVKALNYDSRGMRLVSGSADTCCVIWDVVNESGLFRLRGHSKEVMQARYLTLKNVLITCSKDETLKLWDLDTQHCFKTILGHTTEVWDFVIAKNDSLLITGSKDMDIRLWRLSYTEEKNDIAGEDELSETGLKKPKEELCEGDDKEEDDFASGIKCVKVGAVLRQGKGHVLSMSVSEDGCLLGCHGTDSFIDVFKILSDAELHKLQRKRMKKAKKMETKNVADEDKKIVEETVALRADDEVRRLSRIKMTAKIRAFQFLTTATDERKVKIIALLADNTLETCSLDLAEPKPIPSGVTRLTRPGHRTDARTVCFSSDNMAIASGSAESVRIWNRTSMQCIRAVPTHYALCSLFAPGDRHVIIGTMTGKIQIIDIAIGILVETIDAHASEVWSICLAPDKRSIVSGGEDKEIKFWDFELITDNDDESSSGGARRLSLIHRRTLQMSSEVLCVRYSADHRLIAAALMDSTVKVFFADTLKFFLSLYGHKLPVLAFDMSTDATIMATGSQDKNVYIWGLDFGNIHKRIFAHDGSVTCVQFVPKTHLFFTGGKDRKLKQWDGDSFQHITTLEGHQADVWCLAISQSGNFIVSASHDRSLRVWEKTEEILVLEEEQEKEREKDMDEKLKNDDVDNMDVVIPGERTSEELGKAGRNTKETEIAANRLLEAIDLQRSETQLIAERQGARGKDAPETASVHVMFQAFGVRTPNEYVLEVLRRIKSSELEECLLVLPLSYVTSLLTMLNDFITEGAEIELCSRCLLFILRTHCGQIVSNHVLLPVIDSLRTSLQERTEQLKDCVGFNLAGLRFLQQKLEERTSVTLFADATARQKTSRKRKRAILTLRT